MRRRYSRSNRRSGSKVVSANPQLELFEPRVLFAAPTFATLPAVTLLGGAPLQIPINGSDADGDTLTYTVSTSAPQITATFSPAANRSLKISVAHTSSGASDP